MNSTNIICFKTEREKRMITLTYQQLNNANFNRALAQFGEQKDFATTQALYNVARIVRKVQNEVKTAQELYRKIMNDYFAKGENGQWIQATGGPAPFEILQGKEAEFLAKEKEFLSTTVEIQSVKVVPADMGGVKISPNMLVDLEPIFDEAAFQ